MTSKDAKSIKPEGAHVIISLRKPLFQQKGKDIFLYEYDFGSADGFLTDNADPDAQTWDMRPDRLADLTETLKSLRKRTRERFIFEAFWFGERCVEEKEVTIEEMTQIVLEGHIGTKTRYFVK